MAPTALVIICMMWLPVAIFMLGKDQPAKGTGVVTGIVGILTILSCILQVTVFKDNFIAALLVVHGVFYCSLAYALITGAEDLRFVGNTSLTTALVSTIYTILAFTGGPVLEGGKQLIARSNFLGLACAGYAALTFMVWLFAYGKFPGKIIAWSLVVWVIVGLWIPAFWLMAANKLPF